MLQPQQSELGSAVLSSLDSNTVAGVQLVRETQISEGNENFPKSCLLYLVLGMLQSAEKECHLASKA